MLPQAKAELAKSIWDDVGELSLPSPSPPCTWSSLIRVRIFVAIKSVHVHVLSLLGILLKACLVEIYSNRRA